ncbi:MAG TPA: hypothetical protein VIV11_08460 [Kofleriaceae bacterium]
MNKLWCLILLVGCGDDANTMPDAGGDPPLDGADVKDCSGAAAVTAVGPAFPPDEPVMATIALVSHDATGAMCGMKDGGSGSEAELMIDAPPGGMVTMVLEDDEGYRGLYTWTEVQPGDRLLFPSLFERGITPKNVDVSVTIPALSGVTTFDVYLQCEHGGGGLSDPSPAGTFTKSLECGSNATAVAAMVLAENGSTAQYAVSAVTPIAASGTTSVTLGAWMAAARPTVTLRGTAGFDRGSMGLTPGATPDFHSVTMLSFADPLTDPATLGPRNVPPTFSTRMSVYLSTPEMPRRSVQIGRRYATPMSLDLMVTTDFLPLVSAQLTAPLPRPTITWSTARAATADAVYLNAGGWLLVTRAEPGAVRFPELPSAYLPTKPAVVQTVVLMEAKNVAGFDALRRDPALPYLDPEHSASSLGDSINGIIP